MSHAVDLALLALVAPPGVLLARRWWRHECSLARRVIQGQRR